MGFACGETIQRMFLCVGPCTVWYDAVKISKAWQNALAGMYKSFESHTGVSSSLDLEDADS